MLKSTPPYAHTGAICAENIKADDSENVFSETLSIGNKIDV